MAQLDVEKKKDNKWWIWVIVAIAAIVILWMVFDNSNDDVVDDGPVMETTAFINESFHFSNETLTAVS